MVRLHIVIGLLLICFCGKSQNIDAFARTQSNRSSVYVEQAIKVSVSVYTATWFTQPLQIENLQIEGAFVQSFKRTQSAIKYINRKKYATLEFYYIVFPYKDGELEFPALNIIAETPPEGDYRGRQVTLTTKPLKLNVKPIPKGANTGQWLVTSDARISERWNTNLTKLQVGDVLNRTITISANGTLPSFIDEPIIEQVPFGNIYSSETKYIDDRDNQSVNGRRIDSYSYLLEKEGEFIIPEVKLTWYNPYVGKYYNRKLPEVKISIVENTDLTALVRLRDSLNALNPILAGETEKGEVTLDFSDWIWRGLYIVLALVCFYFIFRLIAKLYDLIKGRKEIYRNSELYWFNKFIKQSDKQSFLVLMYQWIDRFDSLVKKKTIKSFVENNKQASLAFQALKENNYSAKKSTTKIDVGRLKVLAKQQRYSLIRTKSKTTSKPSLLIEKINP